MSIPEDAVNIPEDTSTVSVGTPEANIPEQLPADPPAPVTIEVPAEHADLIQRAVALLALGEQFVSDNIHAGIRMLEDLFSGVKAKDQS